MINGAVAQQEEQRGEPSRGRPLPRREVRVLAGSISPEWPFQPARPRARNVDGKSTFFRKCQRCSSFFSMAGRSVKAAKYCTRYCMRRYERLKKFPVTCRHCRIGFVSKVKTARYCSKVCDFKAKYARVLERKAA